MLSYNKHIQDVIKASANLKYKLSEDENIINNISEAVNLIIDTYKNNGKVLIAGNGGSAADAQHLAAELSGKFYLDRDPLNAEALHVNTSYITAAANDYGYNTIFKRALQAKAQKNDLFIALSTSGNSTNIIEALQYANKNNIKSIGLTGIDGGLMTNLCNILIKVPSKDTPRIQEMHILIGHILCEITEKEIFKNVDK
jgi:D-sedoheptulose 7-phosphate isomerase